ncbi:MULTISPECIES: IPT/TIG domain-containing protein [unclassified Carboxylicivirga]|uniref:IPT/TIG domain-containing protein n=1 Tax=Carboxylicivirga TaxID=1628153 RepID=UPI003D358CD6
MSMLIVFGLFSACEEDKTEVFWNDKQAPTLISISPASAKEGNEITIEGKYFSSTADNKVTLNGLEAEVTAANLTTIKAIVPEGATSGDIVVNKNGMASNSLPCTIVPLVIPTVASISPEKGKIGEEVIITGTDFSTTPSENIVKFNGTEATVIESTETTITAKVPPGATTGNVTVTRDRESNGVMFTVKISYNFTMQISADEDDVEEGALNGAMALTSSDLELAEYDTWDAISGTDQGVQTIGLRFNEIAIPTGASILSASIQFTCDAPGADEAQMTIYGENTGNSQPFTEEAYNVTRRSKTTENSVWEIPEWEAAGDAGMAQRTTELAGVVQEIVDRQDWSSGNSMSFILEPSGSSVNETSSKGGREAEAGVGDDAAILTIIYELESN